MVSLILLVRSLIYNGDLRSDLRNFQLPVSKHESITHRWVKGDRGDAAREESVRATGCTFTSREAAIHTR